MMNRSYQHSFLQSAAKRQQHQTFNSSTEIESIAPPSVLRDNVEGSTTDIIYPRGIDKVGQRQEYVPQQTSHPAKLTREPIISNEPRLQTDERKELGYGIVDEKNWQRMSKLDSKRRKSGKKPDKQLSLMLRKNATSLDSNGKLNLVGSYITEIDKLPDKLAMRVKTLFLSHNSLENLLGISQFQNLTCISLANNSIRYLDTLMPLSSLVHLEKLTLEGNIVTTMPYYREIVLGLCCMPEQSGLIVLDGCRVSPEEKRNCRTNYRRAAGQMEQMRCSGLRVAVMSHLQGLTRCHAEIVRLVLGRFRSMLGRHIDANSDPASAGQSGGGPGRRVAYVCNTLRYALAGGVYRWLQITGGMDFERRAQDVSYRLFLTATKKMSPAQRSSLHTNLSEMTALWDDLSGECIRHQQRECLALLQECEVSHEMLLAATMGGSSGALRRSREYDVGCHAAQDAGMLRLSMEKENRGPFTGATGGDAYGGDAKSEQGLVGSADAMSVLQMLQFEGMEPFTGTFPTQSPVADSRGNRFAWEVQITYCGLGPHFHLPVRDVLMFEEVKRTKVHREQLRQAEKAHQKREHQLQEERSVLMVEQAAARSSDGAAYRYGLGIDELVAIPEEGSGNDEELDVRQKYMRVLKSNLKHASSVSSTSSRGARPPSQQHRTLGHRRKGSSSSNRGDVIKSVVKKCLDGAPAGPSASESIGTKRSLTGSGAGSRCKSPGGGHSGDNAKGGAPQCDDGRDWTPPPSPPRGDGLHVRFSRSADTAAPDISTSGGATQLHSPHHAHGDSVDRIDQDVAPPGGAIVISADVQAENELLQSLFSDDVRSFLASASASSRDGQFFPPSSEWTEGLFSNDTLGIPSEIVFAARNCAAAEVEGGAVELPSNILGLPPTAWICPNTAVTAAPSMRSLNKLLDNGLEDAAQIFRHARTLWSARLNLIKYTQRIAQQMTASADRGADGLRQLAGTVHQQREANDRAVDMLSPALALEERLKVRRCELENLRRRIEESRAVTAVVEEKVEAADDRKEQLLRAADEVADAVVAMRDEMEHSDQVREAIRFHHVSTLAREFFFSVGKLRSFRKQALYQLRRRTTRQARIRAFYHRCVVHREVEILLQVLKRWKLFLLKQKNHVIAVRWITRSRLDKLFTGWRRKLDQSQATTRHIYKWQRRHVHRAIYHWRLGLRSRKRIRQSRLLKEQYADRFRLRWIVYYWQVHVKRTSRRLLGHASELSSASFGADFHHIDQIASRHFKHTLLLAWIKLTRKSKRNLGDRCAVLKSLYSSRLRDWSFCLWRSFSTARMQWRRNAYSRAVKALRNTRRRKQISRYARQRGMDFYFFKVQLIALKQFFWAAKRSQVLRKRFFQVQQKNHTRVVVHAMSEWARIVQSEEYRKQMEARAMGLYIFHMTRRVWSAWRNCHLGEVEGRRVKRALAAAEVDRERRKDGGEEYIPTAASAGGAQDRIKSERASGLSGNVELARLNLPGELLTSLLEREVARVGIDAVSDDDSEYSGSECDRSSDISSCDGHVTCSARSAGSSGPPTGGRVYGRAARDSRTALSLRRLEVESKRESETLGRSPVGPSVHVAVRRVKAAAYLGWWKFYARYKRHLITISLISRRRANRHVLGRSFGALLTLWSRKCLDRLSAAMGIADGQEDFNERVKVAKEEVTTLRIKLEATRFSLDEQRANLAEKQSQAELLQSAVLSANGRIEMCQVEIDNMRSTELEIKDKIQAIFITCQGRKSSGCGGSADSMESSAFEGVDVAAIYRRVMGRPDPYISVGAAGDGEQDSRTVDDNVGTEQKDTETAGTKGGIGSSADDRAHTRPYAYEINECMKRRLSLLADAEAEYRDAVATSREKDREKGKLHDTVQQAFELAYQCKSVLVTLAKEADGLIVQRRQAEGTLKECEKALDIAVERVGEKKRREELETEELLSERKELLERHQTAADEEESLRVELEQLRLYEARADQNLSERDAAVTMGEADSLAAQHSAHTSVALESTRSRLSTKQIQSADALRGAVDATIPGRITVTDRTIRNSMLPPRSDEEQLLLQRSYDDSVVATRRGMHTQEELADGTQNRSLYRRHMTTAHSSNAEGLKTVPTDNSDRKRSNDHELRRSLSASSYNRRVPANSSTGYSSQNSDHDAASSCSSSGVHVAGSCSDRRDLTVLNTQIQSLSSRIRDRLQRPPSV